MCIWNFIYSTLGHVAAKSSVICQWRKHCLTPSHWQPFNIARPGFEPGQRQDTVSRQWQRLRPPSWEVSGNFLACPGQDSNQGSGEIQQVVIGNALDHSAIGAGPNTHKRDLHTVNTKQISL